ncbi:MAG: multicopper oxidase domain-containing protein [Gaiellales bacterium]
MPLNPHDVPLGVGRRAVAVAIAFTGIAMIVSLALWLVVMSGRGDTGAVVKPAAGSVANGSMAGMPGMAATSSGTSAVSAPITVPENAAALALAHKPYPAALPPVAAAPVRHFTLTLKDRVVDVAPGIHYAGWTFDGTAPGPVLHVTQGQMVDITLVNGGAIPHSIDFHAADVAPNLAFASVDPKKSIHFRFRANTPGAFMYHCGTAPVLAHIANGMYGAIIVDPKGGLPKVDKSVVIVSSEWYLAGTGGKTPYMLDFVKAVHKQPDFVTWNGYAAQYKDHPLTARPGQTVRFYVVDAGPSFDTDFHVVGTILHRVYLDGTTTDVLHNVQTELVPAGGGMVFDVTFHQKGIYPFVSHSFASVDMGEVGLVNVGNVSGTMSH